jgi:hypothetical protein
MVSSGIEPRFSGHPISSTEGADQGKHISRAILQPQPSIVLQCCRYSHSYALFESECCVLHGQEVTRIQMTEMSFLNAEGKDRRILNVKIIENSRGQQIQLQ